MIRSGLPVARHRTFVPVFVLPGPGRVDRALRPVERRHLRVLPSDFRSWESGPQRAGLPPLRTAGGRRGVTHRPARRRGGARGCDNGRMSTPDDNGEPREVLSSLPRSRRQRPSARREAARAGRATPRRSRRPPPSRRRPHGREGQGEAQGEDRRPSRASARRPSPRHARPPPPRPRSSPPPATPHPARAPAAAAPTPPPPSPASPGPSAASSPSRPARARGPRRATGAAHAGSHGPATSRSRRERWPGPRRPVTSPAQTSTPKGRSCSLQTTAELPRVHHAGDGGPTADRTSAGANRDTSRSAARSARARQLTP